jgi:hypothetical protein
MSKSDTLSTTEVGSNLVKDNYVFTGNARKMGGAEACGQKCRQNGLTSPI